MPALADRQGDVNDDDYYTQNPWYGQPKDRPVFGLGKPLPHKVRFQAKTKSNDVKNQSRKRNNVDVEKGEGGPDKTSRKARGRSVRISDSAGQSSGTQRQDSKAAHSTKTSSSDDFGKQRHGFEASHLTGNGTEVLDDTNPFNGSFRLASFAHGNESDEGNLGEKWGQTGEPVGQREADEAEQGGENPNRYRNWWARTRAKYPEPFSEFLSVRCSCH